jgi:hypothetical protein
MYRQPVHRLQIESLGPAPTGYVDVRALGLRAFVDDEYFQYFIAAISGLEQLTVLRASSAPDEALMWRAIAAVAVRAITAAVRSAQTTATLPTTEPSKAVELRLDPYEVRQAMDDEASLPATADAGTFVAYVEL